MKYCSNCGYKTEDGFTFCPKCGKPIPAAEYASGYHAPRTSQLPTEIKTEVSREFFETSYSDGPNRERSSRGQTSYRPAWKDDSYDNTYYSRVYTTDPDHSYYDTDKGGFWWWFLGFILPVVGFILYLTMKESRPNTAHSAASGALVMLILIAILTALFMVAVLNGFISLV